MKFLLSHFVISLPSIRPGQLIFRLHWQACNLGQTVLKTHFLFLYWLNIIYTVSIMYCYVILVSSVIIYFRVGGGWEIGGSGKGWVWLVQLNSDLLYVSLQNHVSSPFWRKWPSWVDASLNLNSSSCYTLRNQAYSNTMYTEKFTTNNENFQIKFFYTFIFLKIFR